ncbi:hypothetical protein [Alkalilimnicola ehrlichii]|uniref:hypothetical protein n=1 Tax=Alkalilimnicola ehrlichii TaxID=351052 RepID=UPI0015F24AAB|nr:hypothetical protein [Alkalilimnicola ehrlichii]
MTETEKLQARLWNAVPDLALADRAKAESIASADELTKQQRKAAYALLAKATKGPGEQ